ncbi:hypothetical protein SXCC_00188 [Gluconacetobacter sp. SXCC-1]|nr:hypothetical protein SXCC_00188 [Gluconacetobacter sp. SXCC-1]
MTITHSPQTGEFSTSTFGEITTSTHITNVQELGRIIETAETGIEPLVVETARIYLDQMEGSKNPLAPSCSV